MFHLSLPGGNTVVVGCIEMKYNPKIIEKNPTKRKMIC